MFELRFPSCMTSALPIELLLQLHPIYFYSKLWIFLESSSLPVCSTVTLQKQHNVLMNGCQLTGKPADRCLLKARLTQHLCLAPWQPAMGTVTLLVSSLQCHLSFCLACFADIIFTKQNQLSCWTSLCVHISLLLLKHGRLITENKGILNTSPLSSLRVKGSNYCLSELYCVRVFNFFKIAIWVADLSFINKC